MKHFEKAVSGLDPARIRKPEKYFLQYVLPFIFFITASFLLYLPVEDRYFVSDDFKVLYRVCFEHIILIKRFFRPLSDVSIYMNYLLGGLNPWVFNSFNILVHGINTYLIYLVSLHFARRADEKKRIRFAIISPVIFLSYPFHNEAVVWLLGRGSSMACLFSLLSLICFYRIENKHLKYGLVCFFYFVSLSAFESTIFFPLIFILLLIFENRPAPSIRDWAFLLSFTLIAHLILRYWIAGSLLGSYGEDFFHSGAKAYILNIAKVGGRLILPPSHNVVLFTVSFILLAGIIAFYVIRNNQKIRHDGFRRMILFLTGMLVISCIIPVITGISTQTSETDRALYFPSVFISMIAGTLIVFGIKNFRNQWIILFLILAYNLFFLEKNNLNWRTASRITDAVMLRIDKTQKDTANKGRVYFLNMPNEINGAYVFRLGFPEALRLIGADRNRFIVVNYLPRQDLEKMKDKTVANPDQAEIPLPPDIVLKQDASGCRQIFDHGILKFSCLPGDQIYFWNIDNLEPIQACETLMPG